MVIEYNFDLLDYCQGESLQMHRNFWPFWRANLVPMFAFHDVPSVRFMLSFACQSATRAQNMTFTCLFLTFARVTHRKHLI